MSLLSSLPAGRADVPPYRLLCARSRPSSLRLVALDITTSTYDTLSVRGHGPVTEIVLDRPEALNALSTAMAEELAQVCARIEADRLVRAVVLSAAGEKAFCVGADLKERNRLSDAEMRYQRLAFRAAFGGVLNLPQPTVAAVFGFALGGGTAVSYTHLRAHETDSYLV